MKNSRFDIYELFPALLMHRKGEWYSAPKQASATRKGPVECMLRARASTRTPLLSSAVRSIKRKIMVWWVWTVEPFMLHPLQTLKDAFRKSEPISQDELDALTPEERKALR